MKWWSSVRKTWKGKPIGFILLSTFLVLFCITVWAANSVMQASEHNADTGKVSFSNHAQEQHARNVAISAARKDRDVITAFSEARKSGDPKALDDAKSLLAMRAREIYGEIAEKRASGMGWGDIAKYYGVHPSVLGLGHSKIKAHARLQASTQASLRTQNYSDAREVHFPNHAQEQHARNVAISAARKDREVIAAFSEARESGDSKALDDAKSLLRTREREIYREIAEKREFGMGWGDIAKYYGVHPSVLGLGHSKMKAYSRLQAPTQASRRTKVSAAKAKSSKGDRAKGNGNGRANGRGGSNGRGNGNGHGGGHGGGQGGGNGGSHGGGKK